MLRWGHAVHAEGSVTFITTSGMTIDVKPKPSALHIVRQDSVLLRRPAAIIGGFLFRFFKAFCFCCWFAFRLKYQANDHLWSWWSGGERMHFSDRLSLKFGKERRQEELAVTSACLNLSSSSNINSRLAEARNTTLSELHLVPLEFLKSTYLLTHMVI